MSPATRNCPSCQTPLPGVAAYCYVCGTATPPGFDLMTGERVAITKSDITPDDLRTRVQRILGPAYQLAERIGAGGFAEVYKALDLRLKRSIAVKVLRPDLGLTPGMLERFRREAEVIAALRHPNIVPIYDVGEGSGVAFIIMPYIAGESLRARMESGGPMAAHEVRRILREAASGLAAAHEAGVIHRDVKPENIMLEGRESRALLMDFGIAKAVGGELDAPVTEDGVAPALTSTGIIVGTPQYMSPEQACGDKAIDARTDQYSLAVVGYRMLSGALPFEGDSTRAVLYKQLVAEATPLLEKVPDAPPGLAAVIARAMQKEPSDRYDDMLAFAAAIAEPEERSVPPGAMSTAPAKARAAFGAAAARLKAIPVPRVRAPRLDLKTALRSRRGVMIAVAATVVVTVLAIWLALPSGSGLQDFSPSSTVDPLASPTIDGNAATTPATPTPRRATPPPPSPVGQQRGRGTPPPVRGAAAPPPPPPTPPAEQTAPTCASLASAGNWSAAAATCTAGAASGDPVAMRTLAGMYDHGTGVSEDPTKAVEWYRKAAPNDAESRFQLSRMYDIGRGTPRDGKASVSALRDAAAMGHRQAILTLAYRLENGAGMERDYNEAALWYRRGADAGATTAMLKLGDWARRGRGMTRDDAAAVGWFRKAADAGSADGAWEAAQAYLDGRGIARDETLGMTLLRKAAQLGQADAKAELAKRGG